MFDNPLLELESSNSCTIENTITIVPKVNKEYHHATEPTDGNNIHDNDRNPINWYF